MTNGDVMKAKQLSDLLYLRVHAGGKRKQDNIQQITEHQRDIAQAIVEALRSFVQALHDAGGKGRYPEKIRKAQQVSCRPNYFFCVASLTHLSIGCGHGCEQSSRAIKAEDKRD